MKRIVQSFPVTDISDIKIRALSWAQQYDTLCWLDSNRYEQKYGDYEAILAIDEFTAIQTDEVNAFEKLKEYQNTTEDYLFGYLAYDLKNDIENLVSQNYDELHFPDLFFFQPKKLIFFSNNSISFSYLNLVGDELEADYNAIHKYGASKDTTEVVATEKSINIKLRIHKDEYYAKVKKLLEHIHRGDIYEANFCQEFYAEDCKIDPLKVYQDLNAISEPPFATFLKFDDKYLLSASPERYLKKSGNKVISQPIKGTAKRLISKIDDDQLAYELAHDQKERAENVMIVDLVRNDLSRTARKGTVTVEELCKVYSFKQVHQMISTVTSEIEEGTEIVQIIKDTFPMGSMTGAPKISAMKIIEELEETKRGLYSGTVGYFTPQNDFDFNVVIRSILYNDVNRYVSYSVGSAITSKSIPENEYEECLLKAKAMKFVLTQED